MRWKSTQIVHLCPENSQYAALLRVVHPTLRRHYEASLADISLSATKSL